MGPMDFKKSSSIGGRAELQKKRDYTVTYLNPEGGYSKKTLSAASMSAAVAYIENMGFTPTEAVVHFNERF